MHTQYKIFPKKIVSRVSAPVTETVEVGLAF